MYSHIISARGRGRGRGRGKDKDVEEEEGECLFVWAEYIKI